MSAVADATVTAPAPPVVGFGEALRVWAKIGLMSFGGPAGQIALMHRIVVDEKRWIDEPRFLHALSYCMLLPGPEAMQLATYVGWLMHGVRGGLAAGLLFVLPGALVLVALSTAYVLFGDLALVAGLLFGLKAAVLAIVAEALARVSRRALKGRASVAIAVAAFVAIALFRVPFPLIVAGAALAGLLMSRRRRSSGADPSAAPSPSPRGAWRSAFVTAALWAGIWLGPVALLALALGARHVFVAEALFFSKVAVVTFGGAYAVLAYVAQQAVEVHHWLRPAEMLTGLGLAETTPGPLILVLVFVGYLAGFRGETGLPPLLAGTLGAGITLWVTFAPCFLFVLVGAPFVERLRANRWVTGALAAVTAAVVGVIANLALWFGLHVLFGAVAQAALGPLVLPLPEPATFDPIAAAIAIAAAVALLRFHVGVLPVLAGAALCGIGAGAL